MLHPGLADDVVPDVIFGARTVPSEPVGDVIATYPTTDLMRFQLDRLEDVYASTRREPLGKTYVRGHAIPSGLGETIPFGAPGGVDARSSAAKELVFPRGADAAVMEGDADSSDAHAMYVKTHGNYAPGERRRRGYDWNAAGVDPDAATFGAATAIGEDGAAKALNPLKDETLRAMSATIVNARAEAHREMAHDALGKVKRLGRGERLPADFVYGAPSRAPTADGELEWDAGRLIQGEYTEEEQAPDPTIGKTMRHQGYKYEPTAVNPERVYGVPSVRTDLAPKDTAARGLADATSYGNEATAAALVNPGYGAERGVVETDYEVAYGREEMRAFYAATGIPLGEDEFEAAFAAAAAAEGGGDACTLGTFQRARVQLMARA